MKVEIFSGPASDVKQDMNDFLKKLPKEKIQSVVVHPPHPWVHQGMSCIGFSGYIVYDE